MQTMTRILAGSLLGLAAAGTWWYTARKPTLDFSLEKTAGLRNVIPLAILGSGPAGLSAGLYGARLGIHTVIFEGPKPGGQLTETGMVENWPGVGRMQGPEIMKHQREYVASLGAILRPDVIVRANLKTWPFELTTDDGTTLHALSLIIATGAAPKVLLVEGERTYWGKGVTTCALCDAPYYRDKRVIVVGGGDTALEEATQLATYAQEVLILVRSDRLRASAAMQARVKAQPRISIQFNRQVKKINGDGVRVTSITAYDNTTHQIVDIPTSAVFLAIGHEPRTQLFAGQLARDDQEYFVLKQRSQQTSIDGVFAAGDVDDAFYRQAGVAAGEGIKAAIEASRFLQRIGWQNQKTSTQQTHIYVPQTPEKSAIVQLTSKKVLDQLLTKEKRPVIIDFYAKHCPTCMHMLPAYEAVAHELANDIRFCKVDVALVPELEATYQVERIPCFIVIQKKQVVGRFHAIMNKQQMKDLFGQFAH